MKKYIYLGFLIVVAVSVYALSVGQAHAEECTYIQSYLKLGGANTPADVEKLQRFLNSFDGERLTVNGIFDTTTVSAVNRFQLKYSKDVLTPWGVTLPTGRVYITTRHKINELYCSESLPYLPWEQSVLGAYRTAKPMAMIRPNEAPVLPTVAVSPAKDTVTPTSDMKLNLGDEATPSATSATDSSEYDNSASAGSSWVRSIFSSGITLVVLLVLLAMVIYAMVTGKNTNPPENPEKKN